MRLRLLGSTLCISTSVLLACSDEASAPVAGPAGCPADQAPCTSGECIPAASFCDGTPNCTDGSDEATCGVQCTAEEFQCGSAECIPLAAYCDGSPNCADGSDEAMCSTECGADQITCGSGECLPLAVYCDGTPNCADGSDEANCAPPGCAAGQIACASGECIPAVNYCDGTSNCADGSDEANCPTGTGGTGSGGSGGGTGGNMGSGGSPPVTGTWHCFSSATIQSSLQSEYDSWKSAYYRDCGDGTACIADGSRCVSEGVAYGMLAAVNMNDQDAFDRLWAYYNAHLNNNGVMNWETAACGETWQFNGATDAELDAAMGLIQADARWGGYAADATSLITIIRDHETETCDGRIILKPGDAWGGCSDNGQINPSYFAPAYYRAFAVFVPAQAQHWNDMVDDTYELYDIMQARMGGLIPDWCATDGSDWYGGEYWWEACRVPWRVATDYCWSGDARAATVLSGIDSWVDANGGIAGVGRPANSCYRGGFALTGVSASQAELDSNVSAWLANDSEDNAYYQGTLRVLYMLVAAGEFPMSI